MSGDGELFALSLSPAAAAAKETPSRVIVRLDVGNSSVKFDEPDANGFTHKWTVYVRAPGSVPFTDRKFIKCVIFMLHESFANPIRVVKEPPFELTECGYGGFTLPIKIQFAHVDKTITINHELCLFMEGTGEHYIEHKAEVRNPTPEFFALVQRYCRRGSPEKTRQLSLPSSAATPKSGAPMPKSIDKRDSKSNGCLKEKDRDSTRKKTALGDVKSERKPPKIAAEKFVPTDGGRPSSAAGGVAAAKKPPTAAVDGKASVSSFASEMAASGEAKSVTSKIGAPPLTLKKMPRTPPGPEPSRPTSSLAADSDGSVGPVYSHKEKKAKKHSKEPDGERKADVVKKKKKAKKKDSELEEGRLPAATAELSERDRIAACLFPDDNADMPSTSRGAEPPAIAVEKERESKKKAKKSKRDDIFDDLAAVDSFQAALLGKKPKLGLEERPSRKLSDVGLKRVDEKPSKRQEPQASKEASREEKPSKRAELAASKDISRTDDKSSKMTEPVVKEVPREDRPRKANLIASKDILRGEKPSKKLEIDAKESSKEDRPKKIDFSSTTDRPKKSELVANKSNPAPAVPSTMTKSGDKSRDWPVADAVENASTDIRKLKDSVERKAEKEKKKKRRVDDSNPAKEKRSKRSVDDESSADRSERRVRKKSPSDKEREIAGISADETADGSLRNDVVDRFDCPKSSANYGSRERNDETPLAETKSKPTVPCRIVQPGGESSQLSRPRDCSNNGGLSSSAPAHRHDLLLRAGDDATTLSVPNSPCHQNLNAPSARQASHQDRHFNSTMQPRPHSVISMMASFPSTDARPLVMTPIVSPTSSTAGSRTPSDGTTPRRGPPSNAGAEQFNTSTATTVRISSPTPILMTNGVTSPAVSNNNGGEALDVRLRALTRQLANLSSAEAMRHVATILIENDSDVVAFDDRCENLDVNLYRASESTLSRLEAFLSAGEPPLRLIDGTTATASNRRRI